MKVKCIANTKEVLSQALLEIKPSIASYSDFSIKIEKEYLVYALEIFDGYVFYFICDEERSCNSPCPFWNPYPAELFEISDGRLSQYWIYNNYQDEDPTYNKIIIAVPEWAKNPISFYSKFIDRNQKEVNYFKKYKKQMDLEFPDPDVRQSAAILNQSWVVCPDCGEVWESKSNLALVQCPKCNVVLNNPEYEAKCDQS